VGVHEVVTEEFRRYYERLRPDDLSISDFTRREIALLQFNEQVMIRHLRFGSPGALKGALVAAPPAHVYYSSAYYRAPEAPTMAGKGWEGADLIFDIDADHIPTPCKDGHDRWRCLDCGATGMGFPPADCPKCGLKKIDTTTWVCERCLDVTKKEVFKLLDDYLMPDFGVGMGDVEICFSGHRGYHLHVMSESLRRLTSDGRREVADYVRGIGLDISFHGFTVLGGGEIVGPNLGDGGWRGRLAKSMYAILSGASEEELRKILGASGKEASLICRNREKALDRIAQDAPLWGALRGMALERLGRIAGATLGEVTCNIDERVTLDTKRLIRYPNTLHGKSGLKASKISYSDLEGFDPLSDAVAFGGGDIKIYVKEAPHVRIGDAEVGPTKGEEMVVPKALGIYLICRGAAEPRE